MKCYSCGQKVPREAVCSEECAGRMRVRLQSTIGAPLVSSSNAERALSMLRKLDSLPVLTHVRTNDLGRVVQVICLHCRRYQNFYDDRKGAENYQKEHRWCKPREIWIP